MEKCGNCNRGLVNGEVCDVCKGTGLVGEVAAKPQKETVVEKVKKVIKK